MSEGLLIRGMGKFVGKGDAKLPRVFLGQSSPRDAARAWACKHNVMFVGQRAQALATAA